MLVTLRLLGVKGLKADPTTNPLPVSQWHFPLLHLTGKFEIPVETMLPASKGTRDKL